MNKYTLESQYEIWNDNTGEYIRVGPDRDGLNLIEIQSVTDDGQKGPCILLDKEQAALLIIALTKLTQDGL